MKNHPWFEKCLMGLEVGPTGTQFGYDPEDKDFARNFNGADIVRKTIEAHGEYLVMWASDNECAFYDTKLMPKPLGIGGRDPFRETVDEAAKHSLPVIAYVTMQYNAHMWRHHPEFRMKDQDEKELQNRLCFNSSYRATVRRIISELAEYPIQGFHLDMNDMGLADPMGCFCESCETKYKARFGKPITRPFEWNDDGRRFLEYRYDSLQEFQNEMVDHIRSLGKNLTVDFNYHGTPPWHVITGQRPVQHSAQGDFTTTECGLWLFGPLQSSLAAKFINGAHPGRFNQVALQVGTSFYHDQTLRPLIDLEWETATMLAHKIQVTLVDKTPYDGSLNRDAYNRYGDLIRLMQQRREHFHTRPLEEVVIYFSHKTRDSWGKNHYDAYFRSIYGAHRACVTAHTASGFRFDENLSRDFLQGVQTVYLPHAAILSSGEIATLTEFVKAGGTLLVTGQTGTHDITAQRSVLPEWENLIGGRIKDVPSDKDYHIHLPHQEGMPHTETPFLVYGPATVYEAKTAQAIGELWAPQRSLRQNKGAEGTDFPMAASHAVGPALLIHSVGKGRVITCAASPDAAIAGPYRSGEAHQLIRALLKRAIPHPLVTVDAPQNVEVIPSLDESGLLRIHLITYNAPPAVTASDWWKWKNVLPTFIEEPMLYRATITVNGEPSKAKPLHASTDIQQTGNKISLTCQSIHECIQMNLK